MGVRIDKKLGKFWRESEFRCRCRRDDCDAKPMRAEFIALLDRLREIWGRPLKPTSGSRCPVWNAKIGGAMLSQHMDGNAADFWFSDPTETRRFVELAEKVGFGGLGHGNHLVHLDGRDGPQKRWDYPGQ